MITAQDTARTGTYPIDFNGYTCVARPALRLRADEVRQGDLLVLDGYLSRVTYITPVKTDEYGTVLHLAGPLNIVRFPHETITVLRDDAP